MPLVFPLSLPFPFSDGAAFDELLFLEDDDRDDDFEVDERDERDPVFELLLDFEDREFLDELKADLLVESLFCPSLLPLD